MTFTIEISKEDGETASLECRELVGRELDNRFRNNFVGFTNRRRDWADVNMERSSATLGGVQCRIYRDPDDTDFTVKRAELKKVLEQFRGNQGFRFPNQRLKVYCVQSTFSIGWVFYKQGSPRKTACLVLGGTICTRARGMSLVADDVHDYYMPKIAAYAPKMRARTAIFHEFGHIFHQLHDGNRYFAMGDFVSIRKKAQSELDDVEGEINIQTAMRMFPRRPSAHHLGTFSDAIKALARPVSTYAADNPLEFVAETFSALLMGVPLQDLTLDTYRAIGGLVPPGNICQPQLPRFSQTVERTLARRREREERDRERRRQ